VLIFSFPEYEEYAGVAVFNGLKIPVENFLQELKKAGDIEFQLLNLNLIAGKEHLYFSILNALHAFKNKKNFSRSLGIEVLLYASTQKQIRNAIEVMGVKPEQPVVLIALNSSKDKLEKFFSQASKFFKKEIEDSIVEEWSEEKIQKIKEAFKISKEEVDALKVEGVSLPEILKKLIIERMALLSTKG
jgi:tRNA threonylcarbamoyladenosine modification (KEOPS) complex Cgi121 subunit